MLGLFACASSLPYCACFRARCATSTASSASLLKKNCLIVIAMTFAPASRFHLYFGGKSRFAVRVSAATCRASNITTLHHKYTTAGLGDRLFLEYVPVCDYRRLWFAEFNDCH